MEFYYVEYVLADVLSEVEKKHISLRAAMAEYFTKRRELEPIKGLARAYALGLLRKYRLVDFIIEETLGIKIEELNPWEKNLLRALIYELKFRNVKLDRVLKVSRKLSCIRLDLETLKTIKTTSTRSLLKRKSGLERLSIKYSQPEWVVRYLVNILGREEAEKLLRKFNKKPTLWIRVNTLKTSKRKLLKVLKRRGLKVSEDSDLPDVLRVDTSMSLSRIPEHGLGFFYVQDKASVLAGHVLSPKPEELILDMCTAPGSKALHIATLTRNRSFILGLDWKPARLRTLLENARRLGVYSITIIAMDSRTFSPPKRFDKILLDPDCTSLGRLGHSPEIRFWIKENMIFNMRKLQYELLNRGIDLLKKGGTLVYSTCTLTKEENEFLIKQALEERSDIELEETVPKIGLEGLEGLVEAQRLYPHLHDTQGFFIAKIRKIK